MKKIGYLAILFLFLNCNKEYTIEDTEKETASIDFVKTIGGTKNDVLQSVIKTTDGGYAVFGYTQSKDFDIIEKTNESFDFWVIKYTADDNLVWQKTFGGSDDDRGVDIISTNDGGFALIGGSKSTDLDVSKNAGQNDFWFLKISQNGEIVWQKTFGFSGVDTGTTVMQTSDDGFLITGVLDVTASNGLGNAKTTQKQHAGGDVWAIKLNSFGELIWSRFFGGSFTDTPFGAVETSDKSYIIAASSDSEDFNISNNKGTYDFWILKISNKGDLIWEKSFGGSEIDEPRGITKTNDNNFIVVGNTRSSDKDVTKNNGGADLWVLKIDTAGNLIWEKTIGGTSFDVANSISKTQDDSFIISGNTRSSNADFINKGQNDAWILKIDTDGNKIWEKFLGGSKNEFLFDAVELSDKSIIAIGESSSSDGDITENKGFSDALIIKIK